MLVCVNVVQQWAQAEVCTHDSLHTCIECGQVWLSVRNCSNKIHPQQEDRRHPDTHFHQEAPECTIRCPALRHTHTAGHSLFSVQRMTSSSQSPLTHRPQGQLSLAGSPTLPLSLAPQPATPLLFPGRSSERQIPGAPWRYPETPTGRLHPRTRTQARSGSAICWPQPMGLAGHSPEPCLPQGWGISSLSLFPCSCISPSAGIGLLEV